MGALYTTTGDLAVATGMHYLTIWRHARSKLGAKKIGRDRRLYIPIEAVRTAYGDEVARKCSLHVMMVPVDETAM